MPVNSSASHGIEIGRRALQAQQAALNTTGHNIANANTVGYSRRHVNLENAVSNVNGGIGTGSDVSSIQRQRSNFDDAQMRVQQQVLGRWQALERALGSIEGVFNEPAGAGSSEAGTIFNEPSGLGLSGSLSRFWNAWQDLANVPESGAARAAVRQEADFLVTTLHQYHSKLNDTRIELDKEIVAQVDEVNEILDELAAVNGELPAATFSGSDAGDLKDRRDLLLDRLSSKVDLAMVERENGQVSVLLSGHNLLEGDHVSHLRVRQVVQDGHAVSRVVFEDDGSNTPIDEGTLRGLVDVRDGVVPDYINRVDAIAAAMVEEINALHRTGFGQDGSTGVNFFDPDKVHASNIAVSDVILADLNNISASSDGNSGDNGMALAISAIRNENILKDGTSTMEGFYYEMLGDIGARSREAQTMSENNRLFAQQIDNRRQSIQGVSLNDEASSLVLYQRAYQAAARAVSIIDDLMEVTINL
jgi:flagellar hook-associated protein 1 FlgK